jgi:hypothetical protein
MKARMIEFLQTSALSRYWSNKAQKSQSPLQDGRIASAARKPHYLGSF